MVDGILAWAFSPLLFHNEMSLLLIFLMGTNILIWPAYIAWSAALRHALPDCGCFGGPDGGRAPASPSRYGCRGYSRSMKPSSLRERPVWRSLRSAFASIWRIRSRV